MMLTHLLDVNIILKSKHMKNIIHALYAYLLCK